MAAATPNKRKPATRRKSSATRAALDRELAKAKLGTAELRKIARQCPPVEHWEDRIVLPVDAVVVEGAETYVYRQYGDHFDRVPVHIEYRDRASVVISNDGSIVPGDVIAARGAYEMHLALKNKAGGGVDPHAGHNH